MRAGRSRKQGGGKARRFLGVHAATVHSLFRAEATLGERDSRPRPRSKSKSRKRGGEILGSGETLQAAPPRAFTPGAIFLVRSPGTPNKKCVSPLPAVLAPRLPAFPPCSLAPRLPAFPPSVPVRSL